MLIKLYKEGRAKSVEEGSARAADLLGDGWSESAKPKQSKRKTAKKTATKIASSFADNDTPPPISYDESDGA